MADTAVPTEADRRRRRRRFEDRMSVAAVLATLLGAIVAFVQSEAVRTSAAWGIQAQSLGVEAVQARSAASDAAELQYSRFLLLDAERRRLGNSWEAYLLGDHTTLLGIGRLEAVTGQTLTATNILAAGQTSALGAAGVNGAEGSLLGRRLCPITPTDSTPPAGCANARDGPDQDLAFPRSYFADASWNAERLTALRDAALQRSSDREGQSVAYTITLTMFGVAIFLFGFTLTPQARERARLFSSAAIGMVGFALIYGAYEGLHVRAHAHDQAAAVHYADGVVALGKADYPTAVRELSETIRLRPDFARPYYERALAELARDAPPVSRDNPFGLVGTSTLRAAIGDLGEAADRGLSLVDASNRRAGSLAQLGIMTRSRGDLAQSAALASQTAGGDPGDPTPGLVRGLSLLGLGDLRDAAVAYRTGIADAGRGRLSPAERERVVAGALTGLDLLGQGADRRVAGEVAHFKALVVGLGAPVAGAARSRGIGGVSITVNPGTVGLTITGPAKLTAADQVSAQWYYEAPGATGWSVVPAISGPVSLAGDSRGRLGLSRSFLAVTTKGSASGCLQPGGYRLELYVDGRLAGQAETRLGLPALRPAFDREMNVAVCLPPGWAPIDRVPGIPFGLAEFPAQIAAWRSPDGSQGAVMMRVNGQFSLADAGGNESAGTTASVAVKAVRLWGGVFPASPVPSRYWTPGSLSIGFAKGPGISRTFAYGVAGRPPSASGVIRAQAAFNRNDLAVVVASFGPRSAGGLSRTILGSVTNALT
ncbi:MAG TPA: hypothetical protein VG165_04250 [Solirubrobacteraceae bacterium]|nr:hypothetical protein [Solirubrobacteraceae bacterium]